MENKKMSEFVRHTGIFPKRALNFWNAKREKKREELYSLLTDADLTLRQLMEEKRIRPESECLERWVMVQAKLVDYYTKKYEKASRQIKEVMP